MDRPCIDVNDDLNALLSEGFEAKHCFYASLYELREALAKSSEVRALKKDLLMGALTETSVRNFVSRGCRQFAPGKRSPFRYAFAALAVVLESTSSQYSEEYLVDLARTTAPELNPANGLAKLCALNQVSRGGQIVAKSFLYSPDIDDYMDIQESFLISDESYDLNDPGSDTHHNKIEELVYAFA